MAGQKAVKGRGVGEDRAAVGGLNTLFLSELMSKILRNLQNPHRPTSIKNNEKSYKSQSKWVLGAAWVPNLDEIGSRRGSRLRDRCLLGRFLLKMAPEGAILGSPLDPKWLQNYTFEHRLAL